jgi:hypothetical protein
MVQKTIKADLVALAPDITRDGSNAEQLKNCSGDSSCLLGICRK